MFMVGVCGRRVLVWTMEKNKLVLIINPNSGKRKAEKLTPKIVRLFEEAGFLVDLKQTKKRGDAERIASEVGADELVVCVGGDGTLHETLNGVIKGGKGATLGYIPMGSVNDYAMSLGIPKNYKKAIRCIVEGEPQVVDACKFNDEYFSYISAAGLFTKCSYSTSQKLKNKIGKLAYILFGMRELFECRKMRLRFDVDGVEVEDDFLIVAVTNTHSVGGIVKFNNGFVKLNDGLMELMLLRYPKHFFQLAKAVRIFKKKNWNSDIMQFVHAKNVRIYDRNKVMWSLDGEAFSGEFSEDNVTNISIVPDAIKIRVKNKIN